jgi:hypothetical protein
MSNNIGSWKLIINELIGDGCSGLLVCFYGLAIMKLIHANGDDSEGGESSRIYTAKLCVIQGCGARHRRSR